MQWFPNTHTSPHSQAVPLLPLTTTRLATRRVPHLTSPPHVTPPSLVGIYFLNFPTSIFVLVSIKFCFISIMGLISICFIYVICLFWIECA